MSDMNKYKRVIHEVAGMLEYAGIPHTVNDIFDGAQVRFPWHKGDIACHHGTYNADDGFVESWELPWDEGSVTTMMPEEAEARIVELYNRYKEPVCTEEDLLGLLELS